MDPDDRRLQQLFKAVVDKRIGESLGRLYEALAGWRRGDVAVLDAHAEVLRHAARAAALSARVARAGVEGTETLLRDAYDLGLVNAAEFRQLVGRPPGEVAPPPPLDDEIEERPGPKMPEKRGVMDKLLADGPVLVHLDARRAGVDVPEGFRGDANLVLRFGHGLRPSIPDLAVEAEQLVGTLTFRGVPYRCVIPWSAVFALVGDDRRGLVWPDDVPPEVAKEVTRLARDDEPEPEPPPGGKPRKGHLRLV